jgi:hypothetical protein
LPAAAAGFPIQIPMPTAPTAPCAAPSSKRWIVVVAVGAVIAGAAAVVLVSEARR